MQLWKDHLCTGMWLDITYVVLTAISTTEERNQTRYDSSNSKLTNFTLLVKHDPTKTMLNTSPVTCPFHCDCMLPSRHTTEDPSLTMRSMLFFLHSDHSFGTNRWKKIKLDPLFKQTVHPSCDTSRVQSSADLRSVTWFRSVSVFTAGLSESIGCTIPRDGPQQPWHFWKRKSDLKKGEHNDNSRNQPSLGHVDRVSC